MREHGVRGPGYGIEAHAVGHPGVDVAAHERAEQLLPDERRAEEDQDGDAGDVGGLGGPGPSA